MTSINNYSEFIRSRHSARAYLPESIPAEVIEQVLIDAQSAPSSSIFNVEPGRADLSESVTLHGIDVNL